MHSVADPRPVAFDLSEEGDRNNAQSSNDNNGWQKVTSKRQRKPAKARVNGTLDSAAAGDVPNVFLGLEKHGENRRRAIEARRAEDFDIAYPATRSKPQAAGWDEDSDEEAGSGSAENGKAEESKKPKKPKVKKPKITVAEAASKIDADDLAAFMADVLASYETQQEIQLMRFADYFGRAFASVSSSQFPWAKMFRESPLAKIADIPISHISEPVYKTTVDWINQRSPEALGSFVLWSLDSILTDLASYLSKGTKKGAKQPSSKSQVAIFVVLAMVLRRKPDVLVSLLPTLRENSKYQGQDKLPVIVWMIVQACQADLAVGLFCWSRNILPLLGGKSNCNPQSRDLVLQLVERILSAPKARPILVNGAVRKGERLMPPSALEILMRVAFPAPSARLKATERIEAVYPTLKQIALAGSPGSKAMKQVSHQIMTFALKAAADSNRELSEEATSIVIWCFTQNSDCYKQWREVYLSNLGASVAVLRRLTEEWKGQPVKQASLDSFKEVLKSFRQMNEEELSESTDAATRSQIKEADKYSKILLGRVSGSHGCLKGFAFLVIVAVAVGTAATYPDIESWDWNRLTVLFTPSHT